MKYILIGIVTAGILLLGYWLMKRLDAFLEWNRSQMTDKSSTKDRISIAFEDPATTASIRDALISLSKQNPAAEFYFYSGSFDEIASSIVSGRIDVAFLISNKELLLSEGLFKMQIPCQYTQLQTELEVEPLIKKEKLTVIGRKNTAGSLVYDAIEKNRSL